MASGEGAGQAQNGGEAPAPAPSRGGPATAAAANELEPGASRGISGTARQLRASAATGSSYLNSRAGVERPRRASAGHLKVEEEFYVYESMGDSEPDAGAVDSGSDDDGGSARRRGGSRRGAGPARRRACAAAPLETVTSGRPKRQRHSRAENPDMLDTEEAIAAALEEREKQRLAPPLTRSRAPPPVAAGEAAAADTLPTISTSKATSVAPPAIQQQSVGPMSASAIRAARSAAAGGIAAHLTVSKASGSAASPAMPLPFGLPAMHPMAAAAKAAAISQMAQSKGNSATLLPPSLQAAAAFHSAAMAAMQATAQALAACTGKAPLPTPAAAAQLTAGPASLPAPAQPTAAPTASTGMAGQPAGADVAGTSAASVAAPEAGSVKVEPAAAEAAAAAAPQAGASSGAADPPAVSMAAPAFAATAAVNQNGAAPVSSESASVARAAGAPLRPRGATVDVLYGCAKCRYLRAGCGTCRAREPAFTRPRLRWKPSKGRYQTGIEAPPVFRPTPEEFQDPIAYITKIKSQAEKYGVAHIVPPPGWDPPFALERGTNGLSMESFRFAVRKQFTSHLCCRAAPTPRAPGTPPAQRPGPAAGGGGRMFGGRMTGGLRHAGADAGTDAGLQQQEQEQQQEAEAVAIDNAKVEVGAQQEQEQKQSHSQDLAPAPQPAAGKPPPAEFGFPHLEKRHTLRSFSAYADWAKEVHFSDPLPTQSSTRGGGGGARGARASQRRPRMLPNFCTQPEPSIEQIEAEFWRIVESPEEVVETLYGQDVDSGHHGSGFPLPLWRRRLLEQHLARQAAASGGSSNVELPGYADEEERRYAEHPWNINNMPRCPDSVLRYLPGLDGELITGVMVPWLYVGSCLSAFCWHVEDHALCSVNYLHMGAQKVWYTVPARATAALEEAMRDALPHLFEANPLLMYQLVTLMSPSELKKRGVPVYRVVHEPGSFIVTMPDSYHCGFNCGFNVAEAVNFAPPSWLPYGTDITLKYRGSGKPLTLSHDSLMVTLVQAAEHKPPLGNGAASGAAEQQAVQEQAAAGTASSSDGSTPAPGTQPADGAAGSLAPPAAAAQPPPPPPVAAGRRRQAEPQTVSPLGPAPLDRVPAEAIALAAGELALRAEEERRRRMVSFVAVGAMQERRMVPGTPPASKDAWGLHINTADCDCAQCSCDLWLSAVVSPAAPGVTVCPEHAEVLVRRHGCPQHSLVLLYRHSPQELDELVAQAVQRVPGAAGAVAAAKQRRQRIEASRVRPVLAGPLFPMREPGQPLGALPIPRDTETCCFSEEDDSSDEDWEDEQRQGRSRGSSKRRRRGSGSANKGGMGTAKQPRMAQGVAAPSRMGRMAGKRARIGSVGADGTVPPAPQPAVPALMPDDIATMFAQMPASQPTAPEQAGSALSTPSPPQSVAAAATEAAQIPVPRAAAESKAAEAEEKAAAHAVEPAADVAEPAMAAPAAEPPAAMPTLAVDSAAITAADAQAAAAAAQPSRATAAAPCAAQPAAHAPAASADTCPAVVDVQAPAAEKLVEAAPAQPGALAQLLAPHDDSPPDAPVSASSEGCEGDMEEPTPAPALGANQQQEAARGAGLEEQDVAEQPPQQQQQSQAHLGASCEGRQQHQHQQQEHFAAGARQEQPGRGQDGAPQAVVEEQQGTLVGLGAPEAAAAGAPPQLEHPPALLEQEHYFASSAEAGNAEPSFDVADLLA